MSGEFRFAWRRLRRDRAVTAIIVLTLALGAGASAAVFSVVNSLLLRPLPLRDQDRLVFLFDVDRAKGLSREGLSPVTFLDYRGLDRTFADVAGWWRPDVNLVEPGLDPMQVRTVMATPNLMQVLGVEPLLGTTFPAGAGVFGAPPIAMISERLWRERYGQSASVVGRLLRIGDATYTITGVMPSGFDFPDETDLWLGLSWNVDAFSRGAHFMGGVARLREGVSLEAAQRELSALTDRLALEHPSSNRTWTARAVPVLHEILGYYRPAALAMTAAVTLLLLTACFNVSSLLLGRAAMRGRELSVRLALGASRSRLLRQLGAEALILAAAATAVGVPLAIVLLRAILPLLPAIPRLEAVTIDWRMLAFAVVLTAVVALASNLAPVLASTRTRPSDALRDGPRGATSARAGWWMRGFVVAEVALACVVLIGAALLIKSVARMTRVDLGVSRTDVLTIQVSPSGPAYQDWPSVQRFHGRVLDALRTQPGLEASGSASFLPAKAAWRMRFAVDGADLPADSVERLAQHISVGDGYFDTVGAQLREGRFFTERDDARAEPVIVVNETFARRALGPGDAIGRRVTPQAVNIGPLGSNLMGRVPHRVIGVVADVRQGPLSAVNEPVMYFSVRQFPFRSMHLTLRGPSASLATAASVVRNLDPTVPVSGAARLSEVLFEESAPSRLLMTVLVAFGAVTSLLAGAGIYALLSGAIAARRRELAIRLALGARPGSLAGGVMREAMTLTMAGLAVGLAAARAIGSGLTALLFDVQSNDGAAAVAVAGAVVVVAAASALMPMLHAARVNLIEGLSAR